MNPLIEQYGLTCGSISLAAAVTTGAAALLTILTVSKRTLDAQEGTFEVARRTEIRKGSSLFRWMEPLVLEIAAVIRRYEGGQLKALTQNLQVAAEPLPWKADEFMASRTIEGMLIGLTLFGLSSSVGAFTAGGGCSH